jgi:selenide,water dikinase
VLRPLQDIFDAADHPDLLIGLGAPDDAAVYRLDAERALIVTTDFFTPIVDNAYQYGAIAAANALSDVYAMGGTPLLALNIAALPPDIPVAISADIMRGLAETVRSANAVIAGGHTIQDKEPKVGLAVVGLGHPDRLMIKGGARPGDVLVLSKPLGTGCITTAAKQDRVDAAHMGEAVTWMMRLNRAVAEAAQAAGAGTATDITGFGFLGHATEIAEASGVTLHVSVDRVPLLTGAAIYAEEWTFPGGSVANAEAFQAGVRFAEGITDEQQMLLFDAQTSGGLLVALAPGALDVFAAAMEKASAPWWQIGTVTQREDSGTNIVVAR